jgi:manganese transport protein
VPLVKFTSDRRKMGGFTTGPLLRGAAWLVAATIIGLNAWLLIDTFRGWLA